MSAMWSARLSAQQTAAAEVDTSCTTYSYFLFFSFFLLLLRFFVGLGCVVALVYSIFCKCANRYQAIIAFLFSVSLLVVVLFT